MKTYPMIAIIFGLMMVFLSGCATTAKYKARLNTWDGRHVDDLVMVWGPPQGSHTFKNGNKMIEYINSETYQIQGHRTITPQAVYYTSDGVAKRYRPYITRTVPPVNYQAVCKTRFLVDPSGKILNSSFEGECYAE